MAILFRFVLVTCCSLSFATLAAQCSHDGVTLDYSFSGARVNQCEFQGDTVNLEITPENTPINNSPWYAFSLVSDAQKNIKVKIKYRHGSHRYHPKATYNGTSWQPLKYQIRSKQLVFNVAVSNKKQIIAGQEMITNAAYVGWAKQVAKQTNVELELLGLSTQKRDIHALVSRSVAPSNEWLVVIGRQHPPELTGAMAYFPFAESLLEDSKQASIFRQRFNILMVPNVNPDGVALGHWRHNVNGIDLNRDWGAFSQVETRLVRDKIERIVQDGGKIQFALDFHSTHDDVFYTMPTGIGLYPDQISKMWLNDLSKVQDHIKVVDKPGHNPNRGVFKQWIADTYAVHAVTYEMGDNSNRKQIYLGAKVAAKSLMKTMLSFDQQAYSANLNKQ